MQECILILAWMLISAIVFVRAWKATDHYRYCKDQIRINEGDTTSQEAWQEIENQDGKELKHKRYCQLYISMASLMVSFLVFLYHFRDAWN